MKEVENLIFDFNGTVLDDLDLCLNILNKMLISNNKSEVTKKRYLEIFTFPVEEYYKKAGFDFKERSFDKLAIDFINDYQPNSFKCHLVSNIYETIMFYKKQGKKIILLSASKEELLLEQLEKLNIKDLFDVVLGTSTIKALGKSEVALKFIKDSNLDVKKTIMIGDTIHDYEVSKVMGVDCVLVSKGHQSKERLLTCDALVLEDISLLKNYII